MGSKQNCRIGGVFSAENDFLFKITLGEGGLLSIEAGMHERWGVSEENWRRAMPYHTLLRRIATQPTREQIRRWDGKHLETETEGKGLFSAEG